MKPSSLALLAAAAALLAGCASKPAPQQGVPPELLNPAVTPQTLQQTVCVPAYAASVTPTAAADRSTMLEMMQRAGIDQALSGTYVLDRRVPVALGGHPTQAGNLQLLEWGGAYGEQRKQALERRLLLMVCEGKLSLGAAQAAIYPDWGPAYGRYIEGRQP